MESSLRIVPAAPHATTFSHLSALSAGAPSAPGLHDVLRAGVGPSALESIRPVANQPYQQEQLPTSAHPLEARLKAWEATQERLRMELLRRTHGIAEPVRRGMELKIARDGAWRPLALGGGAGRASVHEDILRGRDESVTWEDVFTGGETSGAVGLHEEMERKLQI